MNIKKKITSHAVMMRPDKELTSLFVAAKSDFSLEGLLRILSDSAETKIVACVEPSEACWDKLRNTQPQILLLHHQAVALPMNEFFAHIEHTAPGVQVIVFGQNMEEAFLLNILTAGAAGYLNEKMTSRNVLQAIREVKKGKLWVERKILEILARTALDAEKAIEKTILAKFDSIRKVLSKQETAVFKWILEGLATRDIATRMQLSEQSVKLYLSLVYKKFHVVNRSQLILYVFTNICPVSNVSRLIRTSLDKRHGENGLSPLVHKPLEDS